MNDVQPTPKSIISSRREEVQQPKKKKRKKKNKANKEYHTCVDVKVPGRIIVFANFFFVKRSLSIVKRLCSDMADKRNKIISTVRNDQEIC